MTKRNTGSRADPFLLKPVGKDYLWGGSKLNDDFRKGIDMLPLAETWECSTHPDGVSIASSGEFDGIQLDRILQMHPEYLGSHSIGRGELPVMVKLIDAKADLSVQVHPNDEYARVSENGELGKDEMWYVLDADRGAKIIYGLYRDTDKDTMRRRIANGTLETLLQKVQVKKDDVFFIRAGIIHAIGAGVLIAEIQERSNLTYRLYDYNRTDKTGCLRPLHIDKALDVADLCAATEPRQPMRVLRYKRGSASELLCRCQHFQVERVLVNTEHCREMVPFQSDELSFYILLCTDGCGSLFFGDGDLICFCKGDCVFVPASSVPIRIHGRAQFLTVCC